ncbi:TauD/TfdA dioxygenase family protein [Hyphococcus sp.]|uniref:TauD/TfdA dioxygenase family protein n=1 Tax=Hyphococcus sp. TaxID=2038636 RepID=UPI0035C775C7
MKMDVKVEKAHPLFGAIVTGIDLSKSPTEETVKCVEDLMAEYAVICIRGSKATDGEHITFSRAFGPLELPPDMKIKSGFKPRIGHGLYDASNLDVEGNIVIKDSPRHKYSKGNELFHADSTFNSLPTKWSLLLAHVVPPEGGDTQFIDTRAVYDALPDELRNKIDGLTAEHNLWHSRARGGFTTVTDEMKKAMPPVRHSVVRKSANGRKAIYLGAHAANIVGMPPEEGLALIDEINAFAAQPHFIYAHKWQDGDLVIWDNRCTLHRATAFEDQKYKRDMRRTTINEYGPEVASTSLAS